IIVCQYYGSELVPYYRQRDIWKSPVLLRRVYLFEFFAAPGNQKTGTWRSFSRFEYNLGPPVNQTLGLFPEASARPAISEEKCCQLGFPPGSPLSLALRDSWI